MRNTASKESAGKKRKPMKAVHLLGTLKPKGEWSHTEALCEFLAQHLRQQGAESDIIRLIDYNIKPGIENDEGKDDDWPGILRKILAADILIFATPIWWGMQSSLLQRAIERMDALNEELLTSGKSELGNKVGGIVITGAEDGVEHIIGNLCNFTIWNGLTMPPASSLSYLGEFPDTKEELLKHFARRKSTTSMARTMARNITYMARLLKDHPLPLETGPVDQGIR